MSWVGLVCVGLVWVGLGVLVGSRQVYIVFIDFLLETVDVVYSEFFVASRLVGAAFVGVARFCVWLGFALAFGVGVRFRLVGSVWGVLWLGWVAVGCVGLVCCVGLGPFGLGWLRLVLCPYEVYIVFLHFLLKTVDVVYSEFFVDALLGFLASWCWFCGGGSVLCLVWVWLGYGCLALVPFGWFCLGVALVWLGRRGLLGCVGSGCCVGLGPFGLVWVGGWGLLLVVRPCEVYIVFIDFLFKTVDVLYTVSEFYVDALLGLLALLSWGWLGFVFGLGLPWLLVLGLGSVWLVLFGGCFGLAGLPWVALGCVGLGCCVGLGPFGLGWLRLVLCPCEVYIVFLHFLLKTVDVVYSEFFVDALLGFFVLVLWGWLGFVFGLGLAWLLVFGFGSVWLVLFGGCFGLAGLPWVVGLCWVGLLCWVGSVWVGLVAACPAPLRCLHRVLALPPQDRGRCLLRVLRGCAAWLLGAGFVGLARFCVWFGFGLAFGVWLWFRLVGSVWGLLWLGWVAVGCWVVLGRVAVLDWGPFGLVWVGGWGLLLVVCPCEVYILRPHFRSGFWIFKMPQPQSAVELWNFVSATCSAAGSAGLFLF